SRAPTGCPESVSLAADAARFSRSVGGPLQRVSAAGAKLPAQRRLGVLRKCVPVRSGQGNPLRQLGVDATAGSVALGLSLRMASGPIVHGLASVHHPVVVAGSVGVLRPAASAQRSRRPGCAGGGGAGVQPAVLLVAGHLYDRCTVPGPGAGGVGLVWAGLVGRSCGGADVGLYRGSAGGDNASEHGGGVGGGGGAIVAAEGFAGSAGVVAGGGSAHPRRHCYPSLVRAATRRSVHKYFRPAAIES